MKVDLVTLGCSKNLVDSEGLMSKMMAMGLKVEHDASVPKGEVAIINTCGFIDDAKKESIDMILAFAKKKREGKLKRLYVMGCLSQRYREELTQEMPEVDKFYGKFDYEGVLRELAEMTGAKQGNVTRKETLLTPRHYAYVKIAEGCDRVCSYCAIPLMVGKYKSRSVEDIEEDVKRKVKSGVKELQLIAQDLTYYGEDLYGEKRLPELVERLSDIKGVEWIRLHYAYPNGFPMDLTRVMRERDNVCKYLDIALQHASDRMLKKMHRGIGREETENLIAQIREDVPGIHLRTTLMVGHPGETQEDFDELVDFTKRMRFERMGAFAYSHEEGTWAWNHFEDDVPQEIKESRLDELMEVQREIAREVNESKVGKTMRVMIDGKEGDYYVGRTEFDSPEVDPVVLIESKDEMKTGEFDNVKITGAEDYELYGTKES